MDPHYQMPYNNITQVEVNDKTFSLYDFDEELICLPKPALGAMIMQYETILRDLEDKSKPAKKYWSDGDTMIYTKKLLERMDSEYSNAFVEKKLLCILKAPVDVVLDARMFQEIVLKATILYRIQRDDCKVSRVGPEYALNSTKSIIFHDDNKCSICDEVAPNQFEFAFDGLIELIIKRKEILADLDSQNSSDENIYWDKEDQALTLKTMSSENSRVFCFWLEGICEPDIWVEEEISLQKYTFDLMLHVALGAPMWKEDMKEDEKIKETRMLYWNSTPFNVVKKIEFSADLQRFTISNESYGVSLTLPTAALKALLDRKAQILSDLESEEVHPSREEDYINEYWTDESYAICTSILYNLHREIDCKVVRFTKIKDNEVIFVAHKEAFSKLLESYQHRRRNSKTKRR